MDDANWLLKRGFLAASSGPCLIGLIEALIVKTDPLFAAIFYMAAVTVILAIPLFVLQLLLKIKVSEDLQNISLKLISLIGFGVPGIIIGKFLIFRNWFGEHQGNGAKSWLLAFLLVAIGGFIWLILVGVYQEIAGFRIKRLLSYLPLLSLPLLVGYMDCQASPQILNNRYKTIGDKSTGGTILIVADTLRADVLSFYAEKPLLGQPQRYIPNLKELADNGFVFDKLYANASWTKPAVASLITGKLARQHQAMSKTAILSDNHETMAELFKRQGYQTLAIANNSNLSADFGFAQGFDVYHYLDTSRYLALPATATKLSGYNMIRLLWERWGILPRRVEYFYQPAEVVSAEALNLLQERLDERPFFLYLHYMDLHDPYFAKDGQSYARVALPYPPLSMAGQLQSAYFDELERLDDGIGQLMAGLREMGLNDKVRIIFTADHGEEFGEHKGFYHGTTLYNEQIRIPLVFFGPNMPVGRFDKLARQIDILPSVAAWHSFDASSDWFGQDLLTGITPTVHLAEEDHQGQQLKAIITAEYSLLLANKGNPRGLQEVELYNNENDEGQLRDISIEETKKVEELSILEGKFGQATASEENQAISPEVEAQLRALGYVE